MYYKSFTIIIYDRNDYKTMIVANLALARSVNYDRKVRCKLKRTFTILNYNPKPFIVQAPGVTFKLLLFFVTDGSAK